MQSAIFRAKPGRFSLTRAVRGCAKPVCNRSSTLLTRTGSLATRRTGTCQRPLQDCVPAEGKEAPFIGPAVHTAPHARSLHVERRQTATTPEEAAPLTHL